MFVRTLSNNDSQTLQFEPCFPYFPPRPQAPVSPPPLPLPKSNRERRGLWEQCKSTAVHDLKIQGGHKKGKGTRRNSFQICQNIYELVLLSKWNLIRSEFLKHFTIKNCDRILLKIILRNFKTVKQLTTLRRSRMSKRKQTKQILKKNSTIYKYVTS